jgi:hypothetical protein
MNINEDEQRILWQTTMQQKMFEVYQEANAWCLAQCATDLQCQYYCVAKHKVSLACLVDTLNN